MMDKLYERRCTECKASFTTKNPEQALCNPHMWKHIMFTLVENYIEGIQRYKSLGIYETDEFWREQGWK